MKLCGRRRINYIFEKYYTGRRKIWAPFLEKTLVVSSLGLYALVYPLAEREEGRGSNERKKARNSAS